MDSKSKTLCETIQMGILVAKSSPGRYGGRYIAKVNGFFVILHDDDPEVFNYADDIDIVVHCMPPKAFPCSGLVSGDILSAIDSVNS